jgi:hypothetical protein
MVSTDYEWLRGVDTGHSRFARPVTLSLVGDDAILGERVDEQVIGRCATAAVVLRDFLTRWERRAPAGSRRR